jgi:hypothetical protein
MAGPWEKYQQAGAQQPAGPWQKFQGEQPRYQGGVLPFEIDAQGNRKFNSDLGIFGAVKRAFMLPGDVYTGKVQMNDPATGRTSDEAIQRSLEMGATFSPVTPGMRAGEGVAAAPMAKPKPLPPTAEQLIGRGTEQVNKARDINVFYKDGMAQNLGGVFLKQLYDEGFDDSNAPGVVGALVKRLKTKKGPIDYRELMSLKNALQKQRMRVNPDGSPTADKAAAEWVLERLYKVIENPDARLLAPGQSMDDAARVAQLNADFRGNYAAGKRSNTLTGKLEDAELSAQVANSGMNVENRTRQLAAQFLYNNSRGSKLSAGMSKEELDAIRAVAEGTAGQNTVRFVANLLGGGGGMGSVVSGMAGSAAGGLMAGPMGAIIGAGVPAIGTGLKKVGGKMAERGMRNADALIRSRSPLYQEMLLNSPPAALPSPALPSLLMRGGMAVTPSALDLLLSRQDRR